MADARAPTIKKSLLYRLNAPKAKQLDPGVVLTIILYSLVVHDAMEWLEKWWKQCWMTVSEEARRIRSGARETARQREADRRELERTQSWRTYDYGARDGGRYDYGARDGGRYGVDGDEIRACILRMEEESFEKFLREQDPTIQPNTWTAKFTAQCLKWTTSRHHMFPKHMQDTIETLLKGILHLRRGAQPASDAVPPTESDVPPLATEIVHLDPAVLEEAFNFFLKFTPKCSLCMNFATADSCTCISASAQAQNDFEDSLEAADHRFDHF